MGVIDTGKELAKLAQQLGNIEVQQKVIDLQGEILEMQEQMQQLRQERDELRSTQQIDAQLVLRNNAYWRESAPESRRGPFCTKCWSTEQRLIPMVVDEGGGQYCPGCKGYFPGSSSPHPEPTDGRNYY